MSVDAFYMVDLFEIVFAVSAINSMHIVRVGCCDSEAVCVLSGVYCNEKRCIASAFYGNNLFREEHRSYGLPSMVIFQWQSF